MPKNKVDNKLKNEDKKALKKQMKETKKQVKAGKKAARLFGKFIKVANKLGEVGLHTLTDRVSKKNKVKFTVTPALGQKRKVTKKAA